MDAAFIVIVALAVADIWWLVRLRRTVAGTVLTATWGWCVFAGAVAFAVAASIEWFDMTASRRSCLEWLVLAASLCPFVARLGAKRPQHRAWHWIVISFWLIAGLPAWQALLSGRPLEIGFLWDVLFVVLVVMQVADHVGTRAWLAPWFLAAGQLAWHPAPRWWAPLPESTVRVLVGLWLGSTALLVLLRRWQSLPPRVAGWTRVWQAFRDRMGVLWSLRVIQRFEADVAATDAPVHLEWAGFVAETSGAHVHERELPPAAEQIVSNLLRRFVDDEWIERWRE